MANTSKEFYLDFQSLTFPTEKIECYRGYTEYTEETHVEIKPRRVTLSLPNFLIFGVVEGSSIILTICRTQSETNSNFQIKAYKIPLTSIILDSVTAIPINEYSFSIITFTVNGQITEIVFDLNGRNNYTVYTGTFQTSMNILLVEHLSFQDSRVFALGSSKGSIYIIKLTQANSNTLNTELLAEVKSTSFANKITSYLFSTKSESVICLKYIGNNLLCYITDKFQFKIWNINLRTEVFSKHLIKDVNDKILINAKILANGVKLSDEDVRFSKSKCFNFLVYMDYDSTSTLAEFDIIFSNIPEQGINSISGHRDFESYYNFIELGTDLYFKNNRLYKIEGRLVDFLVYDDKFFCLTEHKKTSHSNQWNRKESQTSNYELRIWIGAKKPLIFNLFDYNRIYLDYVRKLLTVNNSLIQRKLLTSLLTNPSRFDKDNVVRHLNNKFKTDLNFSHIANFTQKIKTEDLINVVNELTEFSFSNEAISLCSFVTHEVEGLGLIRKNGLSFIKSLTDWEGLNEKVVHFENIFRQMIDLPKLINGSPEDINYFYKMTNNQINSYIREDSDNVLPLIFALLRVYLTEVFLLLEDEAYVMDCLANQTLDQFTDSHIRNNINNQFSNLPFLDVFNEIIENLQINYSNIIEQTSNLLMNELEEFLNDKEIQDELKSKILNLNSTPLVGDQRYLNSNFVLNPKLSELVSKLSFNKIQSLFNLSRDLFALDMRNNDAREEVKRLFFKTYSSYLLSLHNIGNTTLLHLTIQENLFKFGKRIFKEKRSNCVDLITVLIFSRDITIYKNLLQLGEYKLLLLLINLESRTDLLFLEILCYANLEDIPKMKECINIFFSNIQAKGLEDNVLSKIEAISGERLSQLGSLTPTMAAFLYLEKQLIYILKEQFRYEFYFHCYSFIHLAHYDNQQPSVESISYFIEMIRSCMKIDPDLALICYTNLKRDNNISEGAEMRIVETFADYLEVKYDMKYIEKILLHPTLAEGLCQVLTSKCNKYNSDSVRQVINYSHVNHFNILFNILCLMRNFPKATLVYYNWANLIANTILTDRVDPLQLVKLLKEQRNALSNVLATLYKCESGEHTYFQAEDGEIKFITKEEVNSLIAKLSAKIEVIEACKEVSFIDEESSLLNIIFKHKLFYLITKYELIKHIDTKLGLKLVINCIKNAAHLIKGEQVDFFVRQVIEKDDFDCLWTLTESMMHEGMEIPLNLRNKILPLNLERFIELLFKYKREQEIEDVITYMELNKLNINISRDIIHLATRNLRNKLQDNIRDYFIEIN